MTDQGDMPDRYHAFTALPSLHMRPISVAAELRRSDMALNTMSLPVRSSLQVGQQLIPVK